MTGFGMHVTCRVLTYRSNRWILHSLIDPRAWMGGWSPVAMVNWHMAEKWRVFKWWLKSAYQLRWKVWIWHVMLVAYLLGNKDSSDVKGLFIKKWNWSQNGNVVVDNQFKEGKIKWNSQIIAVVNVKFDWKCLCKVWNLKKNLFIENFRNLPYW